MNQSFDSTFGKAIYAFLGFGMPLILIAAIFLLGWVNLPMMILTFSWLGFAIIFYMGLTDENIAG